MNSAWKEKLDRNLPAVLIAGLAIFALVFYLFAFVLPNHPPRPRSVPKSATLVLFGFDHVWQECWFDPVPQQDRCHIYNGGGIVLNDGVFLAMDGGPAIPQDQLKIASGGNWYSVHLLNGKVLIPQEHFDEIRRELNGDFSHAK